MKNLLPHYNINEFCEYPVRLLIFVLEKLRIRDLFKNHVKDPRLRKGIYALESLLMVALCHFLFRSKSKNNFYQAYYQGRSYRCLSRLSEIDQQHFPCIKTLDDLFLMLNPNDLEPILFILFKKLCQMKVFTKEKGFFLTIDAYCSHCYAEISSHAPCPYCLKRQRDDSIWYLHINVVASIVFPGGFQLPLYVHRLKAQNEWLGLSDKKFKEECELSALKTILEKIRQYLPKTKFTLLLDALYANAPAIDLLQFYHMGYAIVLKKLQISQKLDKREEIHNKVEAVFEKGRFNICQSFKFCKADYRGRLLNVVDLKETAKKKPSKRFAIIYLKKTHWQWIVHQTLSNQNVCSVCTGARLRWREEDLFNTLKNRGFNATHDFCRNFQAAGVWLSLMMIAFALSSIILYSQLGVKARKKGCSIIFFMQQMMLDLIYLSTSLIFDVAFPKQLRFSIHPQAG